MNEEIIDIETCLYKDYFKSSTKVNSYSEIGIMIEGRMKRYYEDGSEVINPGQLWITDETEKHHFEILKYPCKYIKLKISQSVLKTVIWGNDYILNLSSLFSLPISKRPQLFNLKDKKVVLEVFESYENLINYHNNNVLQKKLIIINILIFIISRWDKNINNSRITNNKNSIGNALEMVFSEKSFISTKKAASACAMSLNKFNTVFSQLMNKSFSRFSLEYRIKGAASSLLNTDDNIKEIIYEWGFNDESHFYKIFKKQFDCTPIYYRRKYRKEICLN